MARNSEEKKVKEELFKLTKKAIKVLKMGLDGKLTDKDKMKLRSAQIILNSWGKAEKIKKPSDFPFD